MRPRNELIKHMRAPGHGTDTIGVALETVQEGFGEYFIQLAGIEGSLELPGPRERVLGQGCTHGAGDGVVGDSLNLYHC